MKFNKFFIFVMLFMMTFIWAGCGNLQKEYYEIKVIVVDEQLFYFIDPTEGKDTFSQNQFGTMQSEFLYLYEQIEGVEFNYNQFFSNIGSRQIEQNVPNGKYYLLATQEIDNLVNQYFFERDAWQEN